jgi:hypothetical protein
MTRPAEKPRSPLGALREFVRRPSVNKEVCELCSAVLRPEHRHMLELGQRKIVCACDPCAILFANQAAAHYRPIPRRISRMWHFALDDQEWDSLLIPINLAFFVHNSSAGRVLAYYPSPAGPTESLLEMEYWNAIAERNPILKRMEPDVEALLVNRVKEPEYYVCGIDHCYRLVGLLRNHWRGFSGGAEVWKQIDTFFAQLRQCCPEERRA